MSKPDTKTQTMQLIWREMSADRATSSPGPKPRFEVDDIVEAAIEVADDNPAGGLTMRAVARRLGVTPMTVYGYVSDKETLVSLAYDAIHVEMPDHFVVEDAWRTGVMRWAEDLAGLYVRHPWALQVSYARPVLGPHEQAVLESLVEVLRTTSVEPGRLRRMVGMLFHAVRGTAATVAEACQAAETNGMTEGEWWQAASTALSEVVPDFADRFPNTMWLHQPSDDKTVLEGDSYVESRAMTNLRGGLEMLLDGVETAMISEEGG